jgi:hypothetical protein
MRRVLVSLILTLLCLNQAAEAASGVLPVGQRDYSFLYDQMVRSQALSFDRIDYQLGPYRLSQFSLTGSPFGDIESVTGYQLAVLTSFGENFRATQDARSLAREAIRGGVALRPMEKLFVYGNFVLDEDRAKDPAYPGKKWRGLAGDVEQAFAFWQTERFDLTAGRFASFWGTPNSFVLGPDVSLDGFGYSFRWGKITLSYRLARLDPFKRWQDSTQIIENRFFAGHRFDFHLNVHLRVGLFETVVFGGEGRQIELFYLNPLVFFHGSQVNEGANDNTFVGFDFSFKPKAGYHLYGQFLIDDMQIENKSQSDQEPDEIGFLAGCYLANILPQWDLSVEYSRVANWTFNQAMPRNRYTFKNDLISGSRGNDYDLASLKLTRWIGRYMAASLNSSLYRQGEGSVTSDWSEPWMQVDGNYSEPVPTGVVEKTITVSLSLKGYFRTLATFDVEAGFDRIDNYAHQDGNDRSLPFVRLTLSALFSTIINAE